mgnify:FL=1
MLMTVSQHFKIKMINGVQDEQVNEKTANWFNEYSFISAKVHNKKSSSEATVTGDKRTRNNSCFGFCE